MDKFSYVSSRFHIIILGAGLAGLCAAYELEKQGYIVTILEAEPIHIGGRVRTVHFAEGIYGELGAMRIPQHHELTLQYVREFNLTLRPFIHSNPEAYYYIQKKKERCKNTSNFNRHFSSFNREDTVTPDQMWRKAVTDLLNRLSINDRLNLFSPMLMTKTLRSLDQLSLKRVFTTAGFSQETIQLLSNVYGITEHLDYAITQHLREEFKEIFSQKFYEIVGGNAQLPAAFEKRLRSKPKMGCNVVSIEQNSFDGSTVVIYQEEGRLRRIEGDYVLCTLPFPILK